MPYKDTAEKNAKAREYYARTKAERRANISANSAAYYLRHRDEIREKHAKRQAKVQAAWLSLRKELGFDKCSECGYSEGISRVHAHHTSRSNYGFQPGWFWNIIAFTEANCIILTKELAKCIPLCCRCHAEADALMRRNRRK